MENLVRILCCAGAALWLAAASDAVAAHGRHAGGVRSHAHPGHPGHPVRHWSHGIFFVPAFRSPYFGPVFPARYWYGYGSGDGSAGAYAPAQPEPTVYVEQFAGTPTPLTQGEIYCPQSNAHYPQVAECPGGWQRVFRPQVIAPADAP